jgi:D-serine dehydratase
MNSLVDSRTKGLPHSTEAVRLSEIGARKWNVLAEDLPLPVALLRRSALTHNSRWMSDFIAKTGVKLAPHGKTSMSPALFAMQLADGAWGITLATVQEVRVARQAGVNRILFANEVIGARDIGYILDELDAHPDFEFYCLIDSLAGVSRLATAARSRKRSRPLQVLIEMGYVGGRTGLRDIGSALAAARAVKAAEPHLILRGVEGFEGLYQYLPATEGVPKVRHFLEQIASLGVAIDQEGLFGAGEILLSAGGSAYYDIVADVFGRVQLSHKTQVVLRSGCYLTHDAGFYEHRFGEVLERSPAARAISERFENALEVWTYVLSVPETTRAILGAGRRDFGHDMGPPIPLKHFRPGSSERPSEIRSGYSIVAINDQHAHMTFPTEGDVEVGDMIALGISHPCTTFDKWQLIYVVDDSYTIESGIQTFF